MTDGTFIVEWIILYLILLSSPLPLPAPFEVLGGHILLYTCLSVGLRPLYFPYDVKKMLTAMLSILNEFMCTWDFVGSRSQYHNISVGHWIRIGNLKFDKQIASCYRYLPFLFDKCMCWNLYTVDTSESLVFNWNIVKKKNPKNTLSSVTRNYLRFGLFPKSHSVSHLF